MSGPFFDLWESLHGTRLSGVERFVLLAIAEHGDQDGLNAYPSLDRLALVTGFDRSTVRRAIGRLRDLDVLTSQRGRRGSNEYRWSVAHLAEDGGATPPLARGAVPPNQGRTAPASDDPTGALRLADRGAAPRDRGAPPPGQGRSAPRSPMISHDPPIPPSTTPAGEHPETPLEPSPKRRAKAPKPDLGDLALTDTERRVRDAILADPTLAAITDQPAGSARDLIAAAGNADVISSIAKAGAWCRANPRRAPRSNGRRFLLAWMIRAADDARVAPRRSPSTIDPWTLPESHPDYRPRHMFFTAEDRSWFAENTPPSRPLPPAPDRLPERTEEIDEGLRSIGIDPDYAFAKAAEFIASRRSA